MARPQKFTPETVGRILELVGQGMTAAEIATKVDCTVGTLRVKCSRMGISLRRASARSSRRQGVRSSGLERLPIFLSPSVVHRLREQATAKGVSAAALAAMLIEVTITDGLCDAVLDVQEPLPDFPTRGRGTE